jgi:hypothetical protein
VTAGPYLIGKGDYYFAGHPFTIHQNIDNYEEKYNHIIVLVKKNLLSMQ